MKKRLLALLLMATMVLSACGAKEAQIQPTEGAPAVQVQDNVERTWMDASKPVEERVDLLLSAMTLEEKAYQMVQPVQGNVTLKQITELGIGSVLSGGNDMPSKGNEAKDWNEMVNEFKAAALQSRLGIPLIYGIDAVHGNSHLYGGTVFPHNIGLGAADDEELMYEIAKVTAEEIRATGVQWDFSPCLGNPQDVTWGRTYECFSQDPSDNARLSAPYIRGLQENGIVACAKHFIGEGYTVDGVNQGNVDMSEAEFDELLKQGVLEPYTSAVNEGVLTVMPSYNSINGVKCHANYHLLTEVLKNQLGFKGFVISDYNAIDQIPAATLKEQIAISVNAGVDMFMEVSAWDETAQDIIALVNEGTITEERLNDAVSRILYVKFVAGLFEETGADEAALMEEVGSEAHREVARKAVRESLVLLKDDGKALDALRSADHITVEGDAAYNIGRQCGGWTINWQGISGKITVGTTVIEAIYGRVKDHATVKHSVDGTFDAETDAIVAVFGEMPYAETDGDRDGVVKMTDNDAKMLDSLRENLKGNDKPVIGIIIAGRPIDMTGYEDLFDVLIMAWLPGTEGEGISDVLFGDYEFTGTLKYKWD